jgi:hypothetical protein
VLLSSSSLLVHFGPNGNAEAHKSKIHSGGEFITLLWAFLRHFVALRREAGGMDEMHTKEHSRTSGRAESCEEPETNNFKTEEAQMETSAKKGTPPCSFTN